MEETNASYHEERTNKIDHESIGSYASSRDTMETSAKGSEKMYLTGNSNINWMTMDGVQMPMNELLKLSAAVEEEINDNINGKSNLRIENEENQDLGHLRNTVSTRVVQLPRKTSTMMT